MQHDEKDVAKMMTQDPGSMHGCENSIVNPTGLTKQDYTLKMDLRLIPILGCTYTILFLDRTNSEGNLKSSA
jgi:hypothetical protein